MGLDALPAIAAGLIAHGADPETPAAVISRGTLPDQESVTAPLAEIADAARGLARRRSLVVGDVVEVAGLLAARPAVPVAV